MNNNEASGAGLTLPPPMPEHLPAQSVPEAGPPPLVEQAPAAVEQAPQPPQTMPAQPPTMQTPVPTVTPVSHSTNNNDVSSTSSATADDTDDKDLIDKAVVEKAKSIIAQTKNDPYRQTQEISGLKAEFLQENYNKVIKLSK